jgi:hypothetical protein
LASSKRKRETSRSESCRRRRKQTSGGWSKRRRRKPPSRRKRETAKETQGEPPTRKRKRKPIAKSSRTAKDGNIKPRIPPFERESKDAVDTRGQLALYINAIQAAQQRTRVFAFYVRKERCRLLCHSRSGTLVIPLIDYTKTDHVRKFFWRYTRASKAFRGHDTTFQPITATQLDDEVDAARINLELRPHDPLFRVSMNISRDDIKYLYVSKPFAAFHVWPLGRGTRCFSAYDPDSKSIVLLKDTWRDTAYAPKGKTYERLHQGQVPNIPHVLVHGDVMGYFQKCGDESDGASKSRRRAHVHYRIVLKEVGLPLSRFASTYELVKVVLDAFQGMFTS